MVVKSLSCLHASLTNHKIETLSNTYTTALMAYVFTLAGHKDVKDELLAHLDSVAVNNGKPDPPGGRPELIPLSPNLTRIFFDRRFPFLEAEKDRYVSFSVGGDHSLHPAGSPE